MLFSLDWGLPVSTKLPEDHDPERTVCFTGHREKSIQPFEGNPLYRPLTVSAVKLMIYRCIDLAVGQGYNCFISGLATGTDLWAAEYVMKKKLSGKNSPSSVLSRICATQNAFHRTIRSFCAMSKNAPTAL